MYRKLLNIIQILFPTAVLVKKSQIILNGKPDESITKKEFIDLLSMIVIAVDAPKFEDQIVSYLQGLIQVKYKKVFAFKFN